MKNSVPAKLATVVTMLAVATNAAAWEISESFKVKSGGTLLVTTEQGSINVESHRKKTVEVDIEVNGFDEEDLKRLKAYREKAEAGLEKLLHDIDKMQ